MDWGPWRFACAKILTLDYQQPVPAPAGLVFLNGGTMEATTRIEPAVEVLRRLAAERADLMVQHPDRFENLLHDYCPDHSGRVSLLVKALRSGIAQQLMAMRGQQLAPSAAAGLAARLEQQGLSSNDANWAVRAWITALGIHTAPERNIPWIAPKGDTVKLRSGSPVLAYALAGVLGVAGAVGGYEFGKRKPPKEVRVEVPAPPVQHTIDDFSRLLRDAGYTPTRSGKDRYEISVRFHGAPANIEVALSPSGRKLWFIKRLAGSFAVYSKSREDLLAMLRLNNTTSPAFQYVTSNDNIDFVMNIDNRNLESAELKRSIDFYRDMLEKIPRGAF
jgi:hypothetical protein